MDKDLVYGRNAVTEALGGKRNVKEVYFSTTAARGSFDRMIGVLKSRGIRFESRSPAWLDRFAGSDSHQGVVAVVDSPRYASVSEILKLAESRREPPFLIILDGIEDPQNLGSIIRSAECAGVHGIIIPEYKAVGVTPSVVKVAAGATEHIKIARVGKLPPVLDELRDEGLKVVGADPEAKARYYNTPLGGGIALVIGSEASGMKRMVRDACDVLVSIPLRGRLGSLNAAVAAAILMFEVVRQRSR
jgi:23S rRNA (guanosine2251-2'-O)-methyltransferase